MVHNQKELLNRFPLLDTIICNLSCSDADKELLRALFLNVYLRIRTSSNPKTAQQHTPSEFPGGLGYHRDSRNQTHRSEES